MEQSGYKDKLTHAGIYGVDMSVKTIEDLLDIDINYYFKVNFSSVETIVNEIGGITAYSKYTFTSYIGNYKFYEGYNQMNGEQALAFARERKSFAEGDIMRGQNQQAVIEGILRKATTSTIITKYSSLLNKLSSKFQTNMPTEKITDLIKYQIASNPEWTITSIHLTGSGSMQYTYSYSSGKLSVVILDEDSIQSAKDKIKQVESGTTFDSSYEEVTNINTPVKVETTNNQVNTNVDTDTTSNKQEENVEAEEETNTTIDNETDKDDENEENQDDKDENDENDENGDVNIYKDTTE